MSEQPRRVWTEEREAEAIRLAGDGMKYADIARRMEVSTNSVAGALARAAARGDYLRPIADRDDLPDPKPSTFVPFPNSGRCIFPIGNPGEPEFRWCGCRITTPDSPYCDACRTVAYLDPKKIAFGVRF